MTKSNNGPFTHHERLRYSYLLKNLAHLNGQQASEFNYLQGKLDAYEAERRYQERTIKQHGTSLMTIVLTTIKNVIMSLSIS